MGQKQRVAILGLDGFSGTDFKDLLPLMPRLRERLGDIKIQEIDSKYFSSPQAGWAEILTGKRWFENGCFGYSFPNKSLSKLSIFSEDDLSCAPHLISPVPGVTAAIANLPLVKPKQNRLWLSDGSLPINRIVAPEELLADTVFQTYRAKPTISMGINFVSIPALAAESIAVECQRLECVNEFITRQPELLIYKVGVFDLLAHTLGLSYLRCSDLQTHDQLIAFIDKLDVMTERLFDQYQQVILLSSFSHVPCIGTLNLNELLERGGYLKTISLKEAEAVSRYKIFAPTAVQFYKSMLSSMESRLSIKDTLAASQTMGAIHINYETVFSDGIVPASDKVTVRADLKKYLEESLQPLYGSRVNLHETVENNSNKVALPDFLLQIEGIEFHNMPSIKYSTNVPRTTHSSKGFVASSKGATSHLNSFAELSGSVA